MLTLVNTNRMTPPIAPVGLDYIAGAARRAGEEVDVLDLCLVEDPKTAASEYFAARRPELAAITFRNVDDCFWPGAAWFVPDLQATVGRIRQHGDAPIVVGGVGFSIFAQRIVESTGVDFGILGDGEHAILQLLAELRSRRRFDRVDGLVWRDGGTTRINPPAWPREPSVPAVRDAVDNPTYFRLGGQIGVETKRGCNRQCIYCPEPNIKGAAPRLRDPKHVADEVQSLLAQGVDVLHLCDSEFNIPVEHARDVCEELTGRGLGERVRWYTYMAVVPFDADLARQMRRAGCAGIDFTGDAGSAAMLAAYRQPHRLEELARSVRLCREHGIAVMTDLLLGGPGETPATVEQTIRFIQRIDPDCAGAALGMRIYPQTAAHVIIAAEAPLDSNPGIHRRYEGPVDLLKPTFYVSPALGEQPARLVRDLIGGDERFFEPADEVPSASAEIDPQADYNYNENRVLNEAIANGARGAYWHILRQLRRGSAPGVTGAGVPGG